MKQQEEGPFLLAQLPLLRLLLRHLFLRPHLPRLSLRPLLPQLPLPRRPLPLPLLSVPLHWSFKLLCALGNACGLFPLSFLRFLYNLPPCLLLSCLNLSSHREFPFSLLCSPMNSLLIPCPCFVYLGCCCFLSGFVCEGNVRKLSADADADIGSFIKRLVTPGLEEKGGKERRRKSVRRTQEEMAGTGGGRKSKTLQRKPKEKKRKRRPAFSFCFSFFLLFFSSFHCLLSLYFVFLCSCPL